MEEIRAEKARLQQTKSAMRHGKSREPIATSTIQSGDAIAASTIQSGDVIDGSTIQSGEDEDQAASVAAHRALMPPRHGKVPGGDEQVFEEHNLLTLIVHEYRPHDQHRHGGVQVVEERNNALTGHEHHPHDQPSNHLDASEKPQPHSPSTPRVLSENVQHVDAIYNLVVASVLNQAQGDQDDGPGPRSYGNENVHEFTKQGVDASENVPLEEINASAMANKKDVGAPKGPAPDKLVYNWRKLHGRKILVGTDNDKLDFTSKMEAEAVRKTTEAAAKKQLTATERDIIEHKKDMRLLNEKVDMERQRSKTNLLKQVINKENQPPVVEAALPSVHIQNEPYTVLHTEESIPKKEFSDDEDSFLLLTLAVTLSEELASQYSKSLDEFKRAMLNMLGDWLHRMPVPPDDKFRSPLASKVRRPTIPTTKARALIKKIGQDPDLQQCI